MCTNHKVLSALFLITMLLASNMVFARDVRGIWFVQEESAIEIYDCGAATLCGRAVWLIRPKNDEFNPDPARRGRSVCHIDVMWGLRQLGPGHWDHGTIYDPRSGKRYDLMLHLDETGALTARAYRFIRWFGQDLVLHRAEPKDVGRRC